MMRNLNFRHPDKPIDATTDIIRKLSPLKWICNAKYDGWRLQIYFNSSGQVLCLTRTGRAMAKTPAKFSSILYEAIKTINVPAGTVLDAELVGPRGHLKPAIYIFDMLAWDGKWLVREPYINRWERCKKLSLPKNNIHLAETVENNFIAFFEKMKSDWDGNSISLHEGIVVKRRNGTMQLNLKNSAKSACMLKLKFREIKASRF